MDDGSEIWIAKPSITNQGHSICVFDRVSSLAEAVNAAEDLREWVVQRYIHPPLLLDGRKFHLRVYALCVGSLKVYVYSDVLVLLAGEEFLLVAAIQTLPQWNSDKQMCIIQWPLSLNCCKVDSSKTNLDCLSC